MEKKQIHDDENVHDSVIDITSDHPLLPSVLNCGVKLQNDVQFNDQFFSYYCTEYDNGIRKLILNGKDLYLRMGRRLCDSDVQYLLNFLKNNSDVTSINLSYNSIRCPGFIDIIHYIIVNNSILELDVQNNDIGPIGINEMCVNGARLKLKILRLNGNKFGCEASKNVALMLCCNSYIEYINVAEVDQTMKSLIYFVTVMRSDNDSFNKSVKALNISRPNPAFMSNFDSTHIASMIGSMLKTNTRLIELYLQKYNFSCHDIEIMLYDGMKNKTLQLLDLSCNNIGDHGINSICYWLKQRPALAKLMLSHNIITTSGARALSFALPFSRVWLLDVSHNNIDDSGITDILNTIKKSPRMRHLRLFGNRVGHGTAQVIHRMLKSGVLIQNNLDVKSYETDGKYCVAYYPANHYNA